MHEGDTQTDVRTILGDAGIQRDRQYRDELDSVDDGNKNRGNFYSIVVDRSESTPTVLPITAHPQRKSSPALIIC